MESGSWVLDLKAQGMPCPPVFDILDIDHGVFADMQAACSLYHGAYGLTEAFDRLRTIPERREYVARIAAGEARGVDPVDMIVEWLLRPWHSIRNFPPHASAAVGEALSHAQDILLGLPQGLELDAATDEQVAAMARAYDGLAQCAYFGGTNASKMLAALRPELFPIWDEDIAEAYGFCRYRGTGYRRFAALVAQIAGRLREVWTDPETPLEDYVRPAARVWQAPLVKLIDEWHWVRITQGVEH